MKSIDPRKLLKAASPTGQKFLMGDFVKIADDLGDSMSHFPKGIYAQVQYAHASRYGGSDIESYSLKVRQEKDDSIYNYSWYEHYEFYWTSVSWYKVNQLTLVHSPDLMNQFIREINHQDKFDNILEMARQKRVKENFIKRNQNGSPNL